jgi:hypothetical protein
MEYAYKEDIECIENQRPALNKLKLLPKVETYLKKVYRNINQFML